MVLPLLGTLAAASIPLITFAQKSRAEASAVDLLHRLDRAQQAFRLATGAGYASSLRSIVTGCPVAAAAGQQPTEVLSEFDGPYRLSLRAATSARVVGTDCHGQPIVSEYYASAEPAWTDPRGQKAFAMLSGSGVWVFFDGVAPLEADMGPGGLATRLEALDSFRIP